MIDKPVYDPKQYQVRTGVDVADLTFEEMQQEICKLIDYLEKFSDIKEMVDDLEDRWRNSR